LRNIQGKKIQEFPLQLTLTSDYALRAMLQLAAEPNNAVIPIKLISKRWQIPDKFLRKIVPLLSKSGLIESSRGSGGGICLAKPAQDIMPGEIIQAVDDEMNLNRCLNSEYICGREDWCPMHSLWADARKNMLNTINSKSLADLADESKKYIHSCINEKQNNRTVT
jgi:Rrf2 family protein